MAPQDNHGQVPETQKAMSKGSEARNGVVRKTARNRIRHSPQTGKPRLRLEKCPKPRPVPLCPAPSDRDRHSRHAHLNRAQRLRAVPTERQPPPASNTFEAPRFSISPQRLVDSIVRLLCKRSLSAARVNAEVGCPIIESRNPASWGPQLRLARAWRSCPEPRRGW